MLTSDPTVLHLWEIKDVFHKYAKSPIPGSCTYTAGKGGAVTPGELKHVLDKLSKSYSLKQCHSFLARDFVHHTGVYDLPEFEYLMMFMIPSLKHHIRPGTKEQDLGNPSKYTSEIFKRRSMNGIITVDDADMHKFMYNYGLQVTQEETLVARNVLPKHSKVFTFDNVLEIVMLTDMTLKTIPLAKDKQDMLIYRSQRLSTFKETFHKLDAAHAGVVSDAQISSVLPQVIQRSLTRMEVKKTMKKISNSNVFDYEQFVAYIRSLEARELERQQQEDGYETATSTHSSNSDAAIIKRVKMKLILKRETEKRLREELDKLVALREQKENDIRRTQTQIIVAGSPEEYQYYEHMKDDMITELEEINRKIQQNKEAEGIIFDRDELRIYRGLQALHDHKRRTAQLAESQTKSKEDFVSSAEQIKRDQQLLPAAKLKQRQYIEALTKAELEKEQQLRQLKLKQEQYYTRIEAITALLQPPTLEGGGSNSSVTTNSDTPHDNSTRNANGNGNLQEEEGDKGEANAPTLTSEEKIALLQEHEQLLKLIEQEREELAVKQAHQYEELSGQLRPTPDEERVLRGQQALKSFRAGKRQEHKKIQETVQHRVKEQKMARQKSMHHDFVLKQLLQKEKKRSQSQTNQSLYLTPEPSITMAASFTTDDEPPESAQPGAYGYASSASTVDLAGTQYHEDLSEDERRVLISYRRAVKAVNEIRKEMKENSPSSSQSQEKGKIDATTPKGADSSLRRRSEFDQSLRRAASRRQKKRKKSSATSPMEKLLKDLCISQEEKKTLDTLPDQSHLVNYRNQLREVTFRSVAVKTQMNVWLKHLQRESNLNSRQIAYLERQHDWLKSVWSARLRGKYENDKERRVISSLMDEYKMKDWKGHQDSVVAKTSQVEEPADAGQTTAAIECSESVENSECKVSTINNTTSNSTLPQNFQATPIVGNEEKKSEQRTHSNYHNELVDTLLNRASDSPPTSNSEKEQSDSTYNSKMIQVARKRRLRPKSAIVRSPTAIAQQQQQGQQQEQPKRPQSAPLHANRTLSDHNKTKRSATTNLYQTISFSRMLQNQIHAEKKMAATAEKMSQQRLLVDQVREKVQGKDSSCWGGVHPPTQLVRHSDPLSECEQRHGFAAELDGYKTKCSQIAISSLKLNADMRVRIQEAEESNSRQQQRIHSIMEENKTLLWNISEYRKTGLTLIKRYLMPTAASGLQLPTTDQVDSNPNTNSDVQPHMLTNTRLQRKSKRDSTLIIGQPQYVSVRGQMLRVDSHGNLVNRFGNAMNSHSTQLAKPKAVKPAENDASNNIIKRLEASLEDDIKKTDMQGLEEGEEGVVMKDALDKLFTLDDDSDDEQSKRRSRAPHKQQTQTETKPEGSSQPNNTSDTASTVQSGTVGPTKLVSPTSTDRKRSSTAVSPATPQKSETGTEADDTRKASTATTTTSKLVTSDPSVIVVFEKPPPPVQPDTTEETPEVVAETLTPRSKYVHTLKQQKEHPQDTNSHNSGGGQQQSRSNSTSPDKTTIQDMPNFYHISTSKQNKTNQSGDADEFLRADAGSTGSLKITTASSTPLLNAAKDTKPKESDGSESSASSDDRPRTSTHGKVLRLVVKGSPAHQTVLLQQPPRRRRAQQQRPQASDGV